MSEQIIERPEKARPATVKIGSNDFVALILTIPCETPIFETWRTVDGKWIN